MAWAPLGSQAEAFSEIEPFACDLLAANLVVFPLFGFNVTVTQAFEIGLIFTVIALVRGYALRRLFNALSK